MVAAIACLAWAQDAGAGTIGRANLDGSGVNQGFITNVIGAAPPGTAPDGPGGVAVDGGRVYWTWNWMVPTAGSGSAIGRANIDGSGQQPNFITDLSVAGGLAVRSGHIYWTQPQAGAIGRANLDGSGVDPSFIKTGTGYGPIGVAVDGAHVYWTSSGDTVLGIQPSIGRANLDGSGIEPGFIKTGTLDLRGVAVSGGRIYWSNPSGSSGSSIGRANVDGSGVDDNFITAAGPPFDVFGVAVDGGHIYWSLVGDSEVGAIARANLDGSGVQRSFIGWTRGPHSVAVDGGHVYWSTVLPPPAGSAPTPAAACSDRRDNDGDRWVDAGDPECTSTRDTSERTLKLGAAEAKALIKRVLRRKFGAAWRHRKNAKLRRCRRRGYMSVACTARWRLPARALYSGKVVVRFISTRGRIKRAGYRLSILKRNTRTDRKRRIRRTGSFRYTPRASHPPFAPVTATGR